MSKENENFNNTTKTPSEEKKKVLINKNKVGIEKQTETSNYNKDSININKVNDKNSINLLNSSNEINDIEDIKRTLISPELSPDEIKNSENTKRNDDNLSNNLIISTEEEKINYNPDPFVSPTMKKKSYKTVSKMDRIILEYNLVKANLNKIISFDKNQQNNLTKKEKNIKKIAEYNLSMLNYLSDLSNILNKLVDNQNIYSKKNLLYSSADIKSRPKIYFTNSSPVSGLENSEKMLKLYEKQYNKIAERLKKIKNIDYINDLKTKINKFNQEISTYEKENRKLYKDQIIEENKIKNIESGKSPESYENDLKKKIEICDKFQNEFVKTSRKIEKGKEYINSNDQKINTLNEKCENLTKMAKDMYNIEKFETIEKIKKRSKEKKLKIERKVKEYEVNMHSIKSNFNKLKVIFEQNKKDLLFMENEKNILIEKYQSKKYELDLCQKKLRDYENINFNFNTNKNINLDNNNNMNNIKDYSKKRKINIKMESLNNIDSENRTNKKSENNQIKKIKKINMNIENDNMNNEINDNNIKNIQKNKMALLLSSGPSQISLTKEKSNFGDLNDMQLLNNSNNGKFDNNNFDSPIKIESPNKNIIKKESINNRILTKNQNIINNDVANINIINGRIDNKETENTKFVTPSKFHKEDNQEKEINVLNKDKGKAQTLSKEMILKGLDEQEKENRTLVYSSRYMNNKQNKGGIDRRNFLKLNFSFVSNKKDNKLNRSLNTLPNERKLLNDEIEEDIITDNSADNINIKETKVKKFVTEEDEKEINANEEIIKNNDINRNNNSIEIDKNLISENKKSDNINKVVDEKENSNKDLNENNDENENENKSQIDSNNKNKRENALNTILYNVNDDTKNEKLSKNNNNNDNINNENKEEEQANKSFEEEHNFDKKDTNQEKDDVNYDFDEGDNIIDFDYEKIN